NRPFPQYCRSPVLSTKYAPGAWHASSINQSPYSFASSLYSSRFTARPAKSTGMIPEYVPLGEDSRRDLTDLISNRYVSGSISPKTTSPPAYRTLIAYDAYVLDIDCIIA